MPEHGMIEAVPEEFPDPRDSPAGYDDLVSLHDRLKDAALSASRRRLSFNGANMQGGRASIFSLSRFSTAGVGNDPDVQAESAASKWHLRRANSGRNMPTGGASSSSKGFDPAAAATESARIRADFASDFQAITERRTGKRKKRRRRSRKPDGYGDNLPHMSHSARGHGDKRSSAPACGSSKARSVSARGLGGLAASAFNPRCGQTQEQPPERLGPGDASALKALRRVSIFAECSDHFLLLLLHDDGAERVQLKGGESRSVGMRHVGSQVSAMTTMLVQSGNCRVEVEGVIMDTYEAGSTYGLGSALSRVVSQGNQLRDLAPSELTLRAPPQETCRCLVFSSTALKRALVECPADRELLRGLLNMVNRQIDGPRLILTVVHFSEAFFRQTAARSMTRHVLMPGDCAFREGRRNPDGIVLLRSGRMTLEVQGIPVRTLTDGQVVGEDIFLDVNGNWSMTGRCVTMCEVQTFSRRLFLSLVRSMETRTPEEAFEQRRLLEFMDGKWKEDQVPPSWPLFKGYDSDFVSGLIKLTETRVHFPGSRIWESGSASEVALYCFRHGTGEEHTVTQEGRVRKLLKNGACVGTRDFLGMQDLNQTQVVAQTLCIIAVLHRQVFLRAVDSFPRLLHSPEMTKLLGQELERIAPLKDQSNEELIGTLPIFNGGDRRFVDEMCARAEHRSFMVGQRLSRSEEEVKAMYVVSRGCLVMTIGDMPVRRITRGQPVNALAFAEDPFMPNYTLASEGISEVWAISKASFNIVVNSALAEKRRLALLINAPVSSTRNAPKVTEGSKPTTAMSRAGSDMSQGLDGDRSSFFDLSKIEMFGSCSPEFIEWIERHLETTVFFPDEVVVQEGARESCMYFVCQGTIIMEGSGTRQSQVSMGKGAVFGEQHVLEVEDIASDTATAVEITLMQALHLCVFRRGLELFPKEARRLNQVAVAWLDKKNKSYLLEVPFFDKSSKAFVTQMLKLMSTRIVSAGTTIVKEGDAVAELQVLRSGAAERAGEPPLGQFAVVGAEVVLGISKAAEATVTATQVCSVGYIDAPAFQRVLQRYPAEIQRLVEQVVPGPAFPAEPELVPFLFGMGQEAFRMLLEASEWVMMLPDQYVVKQGSSGDKLYMFCYGYAIVEVDAVSVGSKLESGHCEGIPNVLGLSSTYKASVRTRTVCHFRIATRGIFKMMQDRHPAEATRLDQQKPQVLGAVEKRERDRVAEVSRRKLKMRYAEAFSRHVETRAPLVELDTGFDGHRIGAPGRADCQATRRTRNTLKDGGQRSSRWPSVDGGGVDSPGSSGESGSEVSSSSSDVSPTTGRSPNRPRQRMSAAPAPEQAAALNPAGLIPDPIKITVMDASQAVEGEAGKFSRPLTTSSANMDSASDAHQKESTKFTQAQMLSGAIGSFAESRKRATIRGKVLRLLHGDLNLTGSEKVKMSQGDVERLLENVLQQPEGSEDKQRPPSDPADASDFQARLKQSPLAKQLAHR